MLQLGYPVSFFGTDPIPYINSDLYSQIGSFFPFAVGGKSGISNARVMEKYGYIEKNMVHIDISYYFKDILNVTKIDNLWFDAEGEEFNGIFEIFYKNGVFDKNHIDLCQVNIEESFQEFWESEQDENDLRTITSKGQKSEIFEKWRICARENWMGIVDPEEFWTTFTTISAKCDEEAEISQLGLVAITNKDEEKHVILPKNDDTKNNLITLGIGRDASAEIRFKRKMKKLGKSVDFYGADPIIDQNPEIYARIGKYFPFAVGSKPGYSVASVQVKNIYEEKSVVHVDIIYFIQEILGLKKIDNLWMDAEFAEYGLFDIFYQDGLFDKNGIVVCQINMEAHLNEIDRNSENIAYQQRFMKFVKKIISEGRFGIFRTGEAIHLRMYMFNFENSYCRDKY